MRVVCLLKAIESLAVAVIASLLGGCGNGACRPDDVAFVVGAVPCDDPLGCVVDFGDVALGAVATTRLSWTSSCGNVGRADLSDDVFVLDAFESSERGGFAQLAARPTTAGVQTAAFVMPIDNGVTFRLRVVGVP